MAFNTIKRDAPQEVQREFSIREERGLRYEIWNLMSNFVTDPL